MRKSVLICGIVVLVTFVVFAMAPTWIGLTCPGCGAPMVDHVVVEEGKTYWGETWQKIRCPNGKIIGIRPH